MSAVTDTTIELYALEYEKGAERYENIYKAVWANFSYLTVVSGGIYAFGSRLFSWEMTAVLAVIPLVFWWLAIFEPMNRYGDEVAGRLSEVEKILNSRYEAYIVTPLQRDPPRDLPPGYTDFGLKHFTRFIRRDRDEPAVGGPAPNIGPLRPILNRAMPDPWHRPPGLGFARIGRVFVGLFFRPRTRYWVRLALISVIAWFCYKGIIREAFFPTTDTVIIDHQFKALEGRIRGVDLKDIDEKYKDDEKIKADLKRLRESLDAISKDVEALKPK